ncbi:hypothetical protein VII00023_10974 [Vibrio ichthyoenteri ATCC 700023]|uniref:Uncharacterized protein n=1 Tax=Vibrio ichthyoenteri ATCC 700023 TaxID=870968 RepID=F9S850_9VIBR|nr:hypothetical protein [Vibrio ichthyoenteri]EGU30527.1 hypothetical protein VII00023_10974 [Vibrio ichthyoenteri ATCC 700023]
MLKRINLWAVGLGFLADLFATFLLAFFAQLLAGPTLLPLGYALIIGLICVVFGGYVTAKIAQQDKVYNAVLVGVAGILMGVPYYGTLPLWYSLASIILVVPAAFWGGVLAKKHGLNSFN